MKQKASDTMNVLRETQRKKHLGKHLLALVVLSIFLTVAAVALAQETPVPSASQKSATGSATTEEKVKELKEKLATKVAELRESQKRGFYGEIAAFSKSTFTLVTSQKEVRVRIAEDTQVYELGAKKTEKQISDLKNTQKAAVIGFYDENEEQQHAKLIYLSPLPTYTSGEVTVIDKDKGTVTIKTAKDKETTIDYERSTKADEYSMADKKLKKSGLSRISVGDYVFVWSNPPKDTQNASASRVLRVPKEILGTSLKSTDTVSPSSSASAKPKAGPSMKPKASPKASPSPRSKPSPTPEE